MSSTNGASAEGEPEVIVAVLPVLGVEPTHVAEAKRALAAQQREVTDAGVTELLWVARALPAALDVLADARCPVQLTQASFANAHVELRAAPTERAPLVAIARWEDGGVIVELVEKRALLAAMGDELLASCTVRFPVAAQGGDEEISVRRFRVTQSIGPA